MNSQALGTLLACVLCAVLGTCTLGVIHAERAAQLPAETLARRAPRVGLIDLSGNARARRHAELRGVAIFERVALELEMLPQRVQPDDLSQVPRTRFAVWVLDRQERLSDADGAALAAFVAQGGAVIALGRLGLQHLDGRRRERPWLAELLPDRRLERAPRHGPLVAAANSPLCAGLAPGERLEAELGRARWGVDGPAALRFSSEGGLPEPRLPLAVGEQPPSDGALVLSLRKPGPVVWSALGLEELASPETADRIARNALRVAAGEPIADLRAWPRGHGSAAVIALRPDHEVRSTDRAVRMFAHLDIPTTLLVESIDDTSQREQLRRMSRWGELALAAVEPGLGTLRQAFERDLDVPVRGHAAPDVATPEILLEAGFTWARSRRVSAAVPRLVGRGDLALVLLPDDAPPPAEGAGRVQGTAGLMSRLAEVLRRQDARAELGGLHWLDFDPAGLRDDQRVRYLELLARELEARDVWFARAGELAQWWRARAGVEIDVGYTQAGRATMRLHNTGAQPAHDVTARLWLPAGARTPRLDRRPMAWTRPGVRIARDRAWIELHTRSLDPGESVDYTIWF